MKDVRGLIYTFVHRDDWNVVDQIDGWLFVYDQMPPQMRLCVDLRMQGEKPEDIERITKIPANQVRVQLSMAKKRFSKVLL